MFEDWKQAWRDAVENFEREVRSDATGTGGTRIMRDQIASARGALARLDLEIERAQAEVVSEREAEQVCLRRQSLAEGIADAETVRIAGEYAVRHADRAAIYERKTGVLQEERALLMRDLEFMEQEMAAHPGEAEAATGSFPGMEEDTEELARQEYEMARLRRNRAAEERLEELKRRMRS